MTYDINMSLTTMLAFCAFLSSFSLVPDVAQTAIRPFLSFKHRLRQYREQIKNRAANARKKFWEVDVTLFEP